MPEIRNRIGTLRKLIEEIYPKLSTEKVDKIINFIEKVLEE